MSGFAAYHGVDAATHRRRVNDLAATGLRPVALNVSGDPADPRYAAVWLERPGPPWEAVQDLSSSEYQARFEELTGQGYALTIVTATGPFGGERYAAVFERGVHPPWFARHRLRWDPATDPGTLTHQNNRAFVEGYIPRCLTVYGGPGGPALCRRVGEEHRRRPVVLVVCRTRPPPAAVGRARQRRRASRRLLGRH